MLRIVRRHLGFVGVLVVCAFGAGIAYRYIFDIPSEGRLTNYLRSGLHAIGLALAGWAVHVSFTSALRDHLRRQPLLIEIAVRAGTMTLVLTAVAVGLQAVLYGSPIEKRWLAANLPLIVVISLVMSALFGAIFELTRLIGSRVLVNFILGTYHRPVAEERVLMFLDLAGSTAMAERMGELRVHDLITRFFFDIDEPILAHGGEVHAYVGDAVIVTWRLAKGIRDGRCLHCFFAVEDQMAERAAAYEREFGLVPRFRAGLHAGLIIVSECGNTKRQIAYFGDAVNVAARLQEYCKGAGRTLVASADLLRRAELPSDVQVESQGSVLLRGRETPLEIFAVHRKPVAEASARDTGANAR